MVSIIKKISKVKGLTGILSQNTTIK